MKRIKITIAYDGTNYNGWQKQNNALGIQQLIEEACSKVYQREISITGASRTDTGVHAYGQVATFEVDHGLPTRRIPYALNAYLPEDVVVQSAEEVEMDFHPRYNAKYKTYCYKIHNGALPLPQHRFDSYFLSRDLDIDKMKEACKLFIGEHDFKGFCSTGSSVKSTVREIYDMDIKKHEGDMLLFHVTGNGFLYNMVRIIVGTLIEVGYGKRSLETVKAAIDVGDRDKAGVTAPAKGLTLKRIYYK